MNQRTYHCSFGLCICVVSSMKWEKCSKALFIQIHCEQIQCDYATSNTFDMSGISLTLYILWHISIIQLKVGKSDIIIPCFCFVNWEMCQMWSLVVKQESSFIIYSKCHHRNSHSRAAWCLKHFPTDSVKQQTPPAVLFAADSPLWLRLPGCRHQAAWSGTERWWQQCWRHPSGSRHDSTCVRPLWSATPERRHTHTHAITMLQDGTLFFLVCVCVCVLPSLQTPHTGTRYQCTWSSSSISPAVCLASLTTQTAWRARKPHGWFTLAAQAVWLNGTHFRRSPALTCPSTSPFNNSWCDEKWRRGNTLHIICRMYWYKSTDKHRVLSHLPCSNVGEAMGDSSMLKNMIPSLGRLSLGATSSHDTWAMTLQSATHSYFIITKNIKLSTRCFTSVHFTGLTRTLPNISALSDWLSFF